VHVEQRVVDQRHNSTVLQHMVGTICIHLKL